MLASARMLTHRGSGSTASRHGVATPRESLRRVSPLPFCVVSIIEFFRNLFGTDFMPHVMCLRTPGVIWLHVVSDVLIAIAYLIIPMALLQLLRIRRDISFHWVFLLFAGFIVTCGATHVLAVVTQWTPVYRFEGLMKAATALLS